MKPFIKLQHSLFTGIFLWFFMTGLETHGLVWASSGNPFWAPSTSTGIWAGALLGYFLGSLPFGLILTRCFTPYDLRGLGSGNIGATNVLRTGRTKIALITVFLDGMKGVLAVFIMQYLTADPLSAVVTAAGSLTGHCFPLWLKFKGGKGVATAAGVLLALNPVVGGIVAAVWFVILGLTRYVSLASLGGALSAPWAAMMWGDRPFFYLTLFSAALVFFRHGSNIKRLINREELKIGTPPK